MKLMTGTKLLWLLALTNACGGFEVPPPEPEGGGGGAAEPAGPSGAVCAADDDSPLLGTHPVGLHVSGKQLLDESGSPIFLRGVNRSGSEYRCIQNAGFFDGPCDEASVRAMKGWGINAVRVPLNESCWLDINDAPSRFAGESYKAAISSYVFLLHKHDLVPILELHWSRAGSEPADRLEPMPNADHTPAFWRDVAETFKDDTGVVFEPFNEPFPDRNQDSVAAWACWRDGCTARGWEDDATDYQAAGMQELVTTIRNTGATQLILLGGVQYSNSLTRWSEYAPKDPLNNLAAAWHIYNFNPCADEACWNRAPVELSAEVPVVATEIGQDDCEGDFISPLMSLLDQNGAGYLAWSWNAQGACAAASQDNVGNPWPLIDHFETAQPNSAYARAFRDHVLEMAR